ncbi:MAG: response regulator transcription factor [Clostridia bacterium]|nr:response regulator transcription factor [Clostridia bacterium]
MRALIVEDEARLAEALGQIMEEQHYLADVVYTGSDGLDYGLSGQYDVIVLDVMLPGLSGLDVARRLRDGKISTPILMLTARDEIPDKVAGLDCGADDYMTKPFATEELLARVRALTRRQGEVAVEVLTFHDLTLNLSTRCLSCSDQELRLGYKEFEVLRILIAYPKMVVPKEDLITKVWGSESEAEDNNVEVYVSFLRKKLSYLNSQVTIRTVRKVGYYLEVNTNDS